MSVDVAVSGRQLTYLGDLLLQLIKRDLLILHDKSNLQLAHTVSNGDELRRTPDETVLLDASNTSFQLLHVGLVVPWLDLERDNRLGSGTGALCSLLFLVFSDTLSFDALGLLVDFVI